MSHGKFMNTSKPKRKKPNGTLVFYGVLLAFVLIFCIALAFAMSAINNWLVRFEASQPTAKCEAVFAELFTAQDWQKIYELAGSPADITAPDYTNYMTQKADGHPLTYIETSAGLSGDRKYIVRCGSEKIATFTLCDTAAGEDVPQWQLGTVEIFYSAHLSITVSAPPEYTVLVNGQALDDTHVIRSVTTKAEDYLPNGVHGYRMNEMTVTGLLTEPEVQVLDPQGTAVEVDYDSRTRCYTTRTDVAAVTEEHRQLLVNAAETYCRYMIGDAKLSDLRSCFDNRTDIYHTITQNTTWLQSYARYEMSEPEITGYYSYSEEYFSARVALTLKVTRKGGTVKEYNLDNTLFFKKAGQQWLVWEMINADPQDTVTQIRLTYVSQDQVIHTETVDASASVLTLPEVTVPEGKTFSGWFTQTVDEQGSTTMELVFEPGENRTVRLPAGTVLEPMTLYALWQ